MSHEIWIGLDLLQEESYEYALKQGFWDHDTMLSEETWIHHRASELQHCIDSEKIALMHSELSEALDALRDGDMDRVADELMDCVIRIADYCQRRDLALNKALNRIRNKRVDRLHLHGRKW